MGAITDLLSDPSLQSDGQHSEYDEESSEEVEQVDETSEGGNLYDVGEDDLEAPDDHDGGGTGVDQGFVLTEGPGDPEDRLGDGQGPGVRPPGGEGGVGGIQTEEAQGGDKEAAEPEPEDQDGGRHLGAALLGDDRDLSREIIGQILDCK